MEIQRLNDDQLCHQLLLAEFRHWNYSRVTVSGAVLEAIEKNINELRAAIRKSLSER